MAVIKIVKCTEHSYEGGRGSRKPAPGCEQCVKAAKDDRYQVVVYNPFGGSKYKKTINGARAAADHEVAQKAIFATGGMAVTSERQKTFRSLLEEILRSKQNLAPATLTTYNNTCKNHLWPNLGPRKLKDMERAGLYLTGLLEGIEKNSGYAARRTAEGLIRLTLRTAVREGIMSRNPLDGIKWPKHRRVNGIPFAPEMAEVMQIRQHILAQNRGVTAGEKEMSLAIVALLIGSGVRVGELLAIDGETDVDHDKGTLSISRQVNYLPNRGFAYGPVKTEQSVRAIPLPAFALAAISETQLRNGLQPVTLPWVEPVEDPDADVVKVGGVVIGSLITRNLLFFNQRSIGKPLAPMSLANRLNRIGSGLMLDGTLHAHSFRHRYTSILDDAGVPQIVIDEVTGHLPSGNITRRVYTHAMSSGRAKVAPAIQGAWDEAQVGQRRTGLRAV